MVDAVVLGYGQSGQHVVAALQARGSAVRVITRSGSGPSTAERVAADILDPVACAQAIGDAPQIYLCTQASVYSARTWSQELPVMQRNVLDHATATGAVVVCVENLYAFQADGTPITAQTPIAPRCKKGLVRERLMTERDASSVRIVSVAAGDFFGPGSWGSHAGDRMMKPLFAGKTVNPVGSLDQPHAFTYLPDLAEAMVRAADLPGTGHELLLVPNAGSITQRELTTRCAQAAGVEIPSMRALPLPLVRALGTVVPLLREVADVGYQMAEPFTVDTSKDEARLGMTATDWPEAVARTVEWWRAELAPATRAAA